MVTMWGRGWRMWILVVTVVIIIKHVRNTFQQQQQHICQRLRRIKLDC